MNVNQFGRLVIDHLNKLQSDFIFRPFVDGDPAAYCTSVVWLEGIRIYIRVGTYKHDTAVIHVHGANGKEQGHFWIAVEDSLTRKTAIAVARELLWRIQKEWENRT